MQRFLIEIFCIGICSLAFSLCRSAIGLQLAATALPANGTAYAMLGKFLCLVSAFHTNVFMLNLVNFPVRLYRDLTQRTAYRIRFQLGRSFIHGIKAQLGLGCAAGFIKDTLLAQHPFLGDCCLRCIQLVSGLFRTVDMLVKLRRSTFFLGKLQTGCRIPLLRCVAGHPRCLSCLMCIMLCGSTVKELFCCTSRRSGCWNVLRDMGNGATAGRWERLGVCLLGLRRFLLRLFCLFLRVVFLPTF